jgi:hypothetical protein
MENFSELIGEELTDELISIIKIFIKKNNGVIKKKYKDPVTFDQRYEVHFSQEVLIIEYNDMIGVEVTGSKKYTKLLKKCIKKQK